MAVGDVRRTVLQLIVERIVHRVPHGADGRIALSVVRAEMNPVVPERSCEQGNSGAWSNQLPRSSEKMPVAHVQAAMAVAWSSKKCKQSMSTLGQISDH